MTVCFSASSSIVSSHWAARPATPWISTIGGPPQAVLKFTRWPCRRTSTRSMVGRARTRGCGRRLARCLVAGEVAVIRITLLTGRSVRDARHEISRNLRTREVALSRQLAQPTAHRAVDRTPREPREERVLDPSAPRRGQVAGGTAPESGPDERPSGGLERLGGHHAVEGEAVGVRRVVDRGAD